MKLHLLFNHILTPKQLSDAKNSLGISEEDIVTLPENLNEIWSNIPPYCSLNIEKHLKPVIEYLKKQNKNDYLLVQGDFGAVFYIVNFAKTIGLTPVYSTTKREIKEELNNENKIIIKRVFEHVCFRKY